MRRLSLRASRARQRVIFRRGLPFSECLLHEHVDDAAVLGVHADRPAVLPCPQQRPEDARVVQHEDAGIRHEQLERGHTLAHERVHLQFHLIGELRDDHVEAVVDGRLSVRLLHPRVPCVVQRLTLVLNREVDHGRCAAMRSGDGARLEVIRRRRPAKRHVEMRVHIDAAGEEVLALCVDDAIRVHRQRRTNGGDLFTVDEHVAFVEIAGGDNDAVLDEERHGSCSAIDP